MLDRVVVDIKLGPLDQFLYSLRVSRLASFKVRVHDKPVLQTRVENVTRYFVPSYSMWFKNHLPKRVMAQ